VAATDASGTIFASTGAIACFDKGYFTSTGEVERVKECSIVHGAHPQKRRTACQTNVTEPTTEKTVRSQLDIYGRLLDWNAGDV